MVKLKNLSIIPRTIKDAKVVFPVYESRGSESVTVSFNKRRVVGLIPCDYSSGLQHPISPEVEKLAATDIDLIVFQLGSSPDQDNTATLKFLSLIRLE